MIIEAIFALTLHNIEAPDNRDGWNDIHPGIELHHENFVAGYYYNSISDHTFFAGLEFDIAPEYFDEKLKIQAGVATGYEYTAPNGKDRPFVPFGRITYEFSESAEFFAFPAVTTKNDNSIDEIGIGVGLQFTFGKTEF